jgi:hypothetical protein
VLSSLRADPVNFKDGIDETVVNPFMTLEALETRWLPSHDSDQHWSLEAWKSLPRVR